ncbi:MAG: MATE family efflux transporter [Elusimicrobiaceae bacterium]|nr:MATE family efflux transporter [Elusimicrobiaceae bacterium]
MKKKQTPAQASLKELWLLSYPLIVLMGAQMVMQFTDRMFLAWHSPDALAACVPAGLLAFTFSSLFMGLSGYTSVFISQFYAKKKTASVTLSLWQGIWLSLLSAGILAALTPLGRMLITSFGHELPVRTLEISYFTILNIFGGFAVTNNALGSFFSGRGNTKIPMYTALAGISLNIVLDYVLIFGKLGLPSLGIQGAAWATVISCACTTILFCGLIYTRKNRYTFKISRLAGFYKPIFVQMVRFGVPNGFGFLMDVLSFTLFTFMIGNIDTLSLQASNIVMSMQPVVFMVIVGLGGGIQILVSKYQGIKRPDLTVQVVKNACKLGYGYAVAISVLFFFGAPLFLHLFIPANTPHGAEIAALTLPLMKLVSCFVLMDATYLIFGDAIRGAGDTKFYMYVMLICAWGLLIPGTWMIVYKLHLSVFWVWSWLTFYAGLTAVLMLGRFLQGKWKTIEITK